KQDPSVAELQKKLDRLATASGAPKTWRGDVGGALDSYNTTRGTEGMFFAQLGAQANGWLNVSAGVEQMRWFGATDTRLNAVAAFRLPGDVSASVRGAVTPSAHFLASWELWGTLDWQALKALNVALWVRHNEYAISSVTTFIPNFRVDVGQVFVSAQVAATLATGSDPTFSAAGKVGYQFTDAVSAYLGGAHGNEPMPPLPAADTTSGFAGVLWDLNATFGVRLDYAFEHRVDQYDKHTIGTGVTLRF
ncbi:MAG: YaiO family outer membrane beta-barrel protein, partial [Deltaproteobacteria bacterium]|nr:YaiO family outer membrane beta-barrel protein [Deltaproteobacteria bacterium]